MSKLYYGNYILKDNGFGSFDLFKKVSRKKNDSEETYESEQHIGYGYTLERAIKRTIHELVEEEANKKEISTLKEYLEIYRQEVEKLKQIIN
jgi:polyhydroxyalkanoate synthesis regulator phasin